MNSHAAVTFSCAPHTPLLFMISFGVSCLGLIWGTGGLHSSRRDACSAGVGGEMLPSPCCFGGWGRRSVRAPGFRGESVLPRQTYWDHLGLGQSHLGLGRGLKWLIPPGVLPPSHWWYLLSPANDSQLGLVRWKRQKADGVWSPVNETGLSWPLHLARFVVSPGVTSTFKWENNNSSSQVHWEWLSWQEAYMCLPREQATSWEWVLRFCEVFHKGLGLPALRKCIQKQ